MPGDLDDAPRKYPGSSSSQEPSNSLCAESLTLVTTLLRLSMEWLASAAICAHAVLEPLATRARATLGRHADDAAAACGALRAQLGNGPRAAVVLLSSLLVLSLLLDITGLLGPLAVVVPLVSPPPPPTRSPPPPPAGRPVAACKGWCRKHKPGHNVWCSCASCPFRQQLRQQLRQQRTRLRDGATCPHYITSMFAPPPASPSPTSSPLSSHVATSATTPHRSPPASPSPTFSPPSVKSVTAPRRSPPTSPAPASTTPSPHVAKPATVVLVRGHNPTDAMVHRWHLFARSCQQVGGSGGWSSRST